MIDIDEEIKKHINPKHHHLLLEPGLERTAPIVKKLYEDYNAMRWPFRDKILVSILKYIYYNLTGEILS